MLLIKVPMGRKGEGSGTWEGTEKSENGQVTLHTVSRFSVSLTRKMKRNIGGGGRGWRANP